MSVARSRKTKSGESFSSLPPSFPPTLSVSLPPLIIPLPSSREMLPHFIFSLSHAHSPPPLTSPSMPCCLIIAFLIHLIFLALNTLCLSVSSLFLPLCARVHTNTYRPHTHKKQNTWDYRNSTKYKLTPWNSAKNVALPESWLCVCVFVCVLC